MRTAEPALAVVTGASSGIGQATVRLLRRHDWAVLAVARRHDRLAALAQETGCEILTADLATAAGAEAVAGALQGRKLTAVVANAGGARGVDRVEDGGDEDVIARWQEMYDINVLATLRTVTAALPALRASGAAGAPETRGTALDGGGGDVVVVTSQAALEHYPGGSGYTAAKHAQRSIPATLRMELLGEPIRVIEIAPGLVHTEEFALRRLGDRDQADAVYSGVPGPLVADDIADAIVWTLTRPKHVNIDLLKVNPVAQASATMTHREPT